jgi:hypothetical protein
MILNRFLHQSQLDPALHCLKCSFMQLPFIGMYSFSKILAYPKRLTLHQTWDYIIS